MSSEARPGAVRPAWLPHAGTGLLLVVTALSGVLPSAVGFCIAGRFRWTAALAGVFGNAAIGLLIAAALFAALRQRLRWLAAAFSIVFVLQVLVTLACAEFMLERGTPISLFDVKNGLDLGFVLSQARLLFAPRFGPYLALGVVLFAAALFGLLRRLGRAEANARSAKLAPFVVVTLFVALSLWVQKTPRGEQARRPYASLLGALVTTNHMNIVVGVEPVLLEQHVTDERAQPGFAMLGIQTSLCADGLRAGEALDAAVPAHAARLDAAWRALAAELRAGERPLSFTFVLLESVGAEDVYALDPAAPRGLTPYLDGLASGAQPALVGRRFLQAGQRTASAMSAMLCGVGTAPALLAPLRDLPSLELRCWTDLAREAGMELRFFYSDNLAFDRYADTLKEHGFSYLHAPQVEGRKRGVWGLSDRELFSDILADSRALADRRSGLVRGVLTLSTHGPFSVPEDMPEPAREKALALARGATQNATKQAHWLTVSYLDDALSRFVPALMERETAAGRNPVVLLMGDHTSGYTVGQHALAPARIPLFFLFPPALERAALEPVQRELDARSFSQNDLPRLVLSLLDASGALDSLPEASRWHSMGGQTLSTAFSLPAPHQAGRLWTIDVRAQSRLLGRGDEVLLKEAMQAPTTRQDLQASSRVADAALPALAWLLKHPPRAGACARP